jgi:hypothetical protein
LRICYFLPHKLVVDQEEDKRSDVTGTIGTTKEAVLWGSILCMARHPVLVCLNRLEAGH